MIHGSGLQLRGQERGPARCTLRYHLLLQNRSQIFSRACCISTINEITKMSSNAKTCPKYFSRIGIRGAGMSRANPPNTFRFLHLLETYGILFLYFTRIYQTLLDFCLLLAFYLKHMVKFWQLFKK